jgi:hypothetical protein
MEETFFFEIHVTVDASQLFLFQLFCNEHGYGADYAIGEFLYNECEENGSNQQLMLTRMVRSTYESVIIEAKGLKKKLTEYGIDVVRVKIEIPANCKHIDSMRNLIEVERVNNEDNHIGYFEFHFKVDVETMDQKETMDEVTLRHRSSHSYNMLGSTKNKVLVAQRIRTDDYADALAARQEYIDDLKEEGLLVHDSGKGVHYEYVVYDDNPGLDDNFVVTMVI